jgi:hypothetical protein
MKESGLDQRSWSLSWILVAGLALAMLVPIAVTPFLGDDIFNSHVRGTLGYHHLSFWEFVKLTNAGWVGNGRFFPGALVETFGVFVLMPSLLAYKSFQIGLTLVNLATFFFLLRAFGLSRAVSLLGVIILVCTFQMRVYYDGLLGFSAHIEWIMELMMLAILALLAFERRHNLWLYVASLALYAACLLIYEITYLFWLLFLVVLLTTRPWREAIRLTIPYFVMSAAMIGVNLFLRTTARLAPDSDYSLSLSPGVLFGAFVKQATAGIPFSYLVFDPSNLFAHGTAVFSVPPLWIVAAMFVLGSVAAWSLFAQIERVPAGRKTLLALAAIGLIFWLTPAAMIASSARYQRELVMGLGHAPVYLEYFGVALLALVALCGAFGRWGVPSPYARAAISAGFGLAAVLLYGANAIVITEHTSEKEALSNMDAALQAGILSDVPSESDLYVDGLLPANRYLKPDFADARYFYFLMTGKRVVVRAIGTLPNDVQCPGPCHAEHPSYELLNVPVGDAAGYSVLGRIRSAATVRGEIHSYATLITVFVRGADPDVPLDLRFEESGCKGGNPGVSRRLDVQPGGTLMTAIQTRCTAIDMSSIAISEPGVAAR